MVKDSFRIPDNPVFGNWTIRVKFANMVSDIRDLYVSISQANLTNVVNIDVRDLLVSISGAHHTDM